LSFGDLLVLLLFVVFVILPSITRQQQQRRGGAPGAPGRPPARPRTGSPTGLPSAGGDPASTRGPAPSTAGEGGTAPFPPIDDDDLARRLAEARARVQRAMEQRGAPAVPVAPPDDPRARAGAPLVSGAPRTISGAPIGSGFDPRARARGPLVSGGARTLSGAPVGSGGAPGDRMPSPFLGREGRRTTTPDDGPSPRDLRANAPRLEVERLAGSVERRAVRQGALRFDADAVFAGIVWHQVLGAPRARRRVGGGPFPER
jgi:hypothetical protein